MHYILHIPFMLLRRGAWVINRKLSHDCQCKRHQGVPHLLLRAQTGGRRRPGEEAETLEVRLQIPAELRLHGLHPLVHWVHRHGNRPDGEGEKKRIRTGVHAGGIITATQQGTALAHASLWTVVKSFGHTNG